MHRKTKRIVIPRTTFCKHVSVKGTCRLKGRDSTDQNIFVISELLTRIITHHTSYTYTHLNSTSQHITERRRAERRKVHELPRKLDISSWAGSPPQKHQLRTPRQNHNPAKHRKVRVLGPYVDTTTKTPKTQRQNHNPAKHRSSRAVC